MIVLKIGKCQNDIFYISHGFFLIRIAMTAFTCKIYITEFFPGNIKTGKIEVKQNSEIIFIGIYIMNIATVYRENLSLIYSYIFDVPQPDLHDL